LSSKISIKLNKKLQKRGKKMLLFIPCFPKQKKGEFEMDHLVGWVILIVLLGFAIFMIARYATRGMSINIMPK
jgi:hypothetical protein